MKREYHYCWEWDLNAPPDALWPLVSDTNRFNRDTGLPTVTPLGQGTDSRHRRRLRFTRLGVPVEWEEEPFEWVRPHRFSVARRYSAGPVREMRVRVDLSPRPEGGTHLRYEVWASPRDLIGAAAIPVQIGAISARQFAAVFRRYDAQMRERREALDFPSAPAKFSPGGRERLANLREALALDGQSTSLVERLCRLIETGDDLTLSRIRPYALADRWGEPRGAVLDLCLTSVREGLLDFRWEMLCPLCRGASETHASLRELRSDTHCDSCHIDFTVNFDRLVELTFRPNAAVREIPIKEFCMGGPQVTPHIVAQQRVAPGEERRLHPVLEIGRYRLRALDIPGGQPVRVETDGPPSATFAASGEGWEAGEVGMSPRAEIALKNATPDERVFVLERTAWSDQAATAAEVLVRQTFRDLFSNEALRPHEQISVGTIAILFTDLRGSTRLYREIGDAPAFGHVMNHFDVLREAVAAEGGSLVKSIGDAVMAVFRRPTSALRAFFRAQQTLSHPPDGSPPLVLKGGLHFGPSIAVTLNDRLDYFGSTVNVASRLVGFSSGEDMIISSSVRSDPEVEALLGGADAMVTEPFDAVLRGYDEESFRLWRVRAARD